MGANLMPIETDEITVAEAMQDPRRDQLLSTLSQRQPMNTGSPVNLLGLDPNTIMQMQQQASSIYNNRDNNIQQLLGQYERDRGFAENRRMALLEEKRNLPLMQAQTQLAQTRASETTQNLGLREKFDPLQQQALLDALSSYPRSAYVGLGEAEQRLQAEFGQQKDILQRQQDFSKKIREMELFTEIYKTDLKGTDIDPEKRRKLIKDLNEYQTKALSTHFTTSDGKNNVVRPWSNRISNAKSFNVQNDGDMALIPIGDVSGFNKGSGLNISPDIKNEAVLPIQLTGAIDDTRLTMPIIRQYAESSEFKGKSLEDIILRLLINGDARIVEKPATPKEGPWNKILESLKTGK